MYRCSEKYKDACLIGQKEYASAYRSLIMLVRIKQHNIFLAEELLARDLQDIILVGAGDMCDLFLEELVGTEVNILSILERRIGKYRSHYKRHNVVALNTVGSESLRDRKIIVMDVLRFNEYMEFLIDKGVEVDNIYSIEEVLACVLMRGRMK